MIILNLNDLRKKFNFINIDLIKSFSIPNPFILFRDVSILIFQYLLSVFLIIKFPSFPIYLIAFFLIGGSQHGMGLLVHEGAHRLLSKNRSINDKIASFFSGAIILPFFLYQERHLIHHRELSKEDDTKYFYKANYGGNNLFKEIIRTILFYDFLRKGINVYKFLISKKKSLKKPLFIKHNLLKDFFAILFVNFGILIAFSLSIGFMYYLLLWLLPLFSSSVLFSKLRSVVEHKPYNDDIKSLNQKNITFIPFMRSVSANFFEKIFFSKFNFHFHTEHHLWPAVSYQYLPTLHKKLNENNAFDSGFIFYDANYLTSIIKFFRKF